MVDKELKDLIEFVQYVILERLKMSTILFLICPAYSDFRKNYIRKYFRVRPNMFKLLQLLNSSNVRILSNLSRFITCATKQRLSLLNTNV